MKTMEIEKEELVLLITKILNTLKNIEVDLYRASALCKNINDLDLSASLGHFAKCASRLEDDIESVID